MSSGGGKLVQLYRRKLVSRLNKTTHTLALDPEILLQGIYLEDTVPRAETHVGTSLFTSALCLITKH